MDLKQAFNVDLVSRNNILIDYPREFEIFKKLCIVFLAQNKGNLTKEESDILTKILPSNKIINLVSIIQRGVINNSSTNINEYGSMTLRQVYNIDEKSKNFALANNNNEFEVFCNLCVLYILQKRGEISVEESNKLDSILPIKSFIDVKKYIEDEKNILPTSEVEQIPSEIDNIFEQIKTHYFKNLLNQFYDGIELFFKTAMLVDHLYNVQKDNIYVVINDLKTKDKDYFNKLLKSYDFRTLVEHFYQQYNKEITAANIRKKVEEYNQKRTTFLNAVYKKYIDPSHNIIVSLENPSSIKESSKTFPVKWDFTNKYHTHDGSKNLTEEEKKNIPHHVGNIFNQEETMFFRNLLSKYYTGLELMLRTAVLVSYLYNYNLERDEMFDVINDIKNFDKEYCDDLLNVFDFEEFVTQWYQKFNKEKSKKEIKEVIDKYNVDQSLFFNRLYKKYVDPTHTHNIKLWFD